MKSPSILPCCCRPLAELKDLVLRELGSTSLFAAKFREASARALLLPKRRAGQRAPLWQTRKRAADLLAVASRYSSFPILLESYRECVRDTFDLANTAAILAKIGREARFASRCWSLPGPLRLRLPCSSLMSRTTSMTATHRWRSDGRRLFRSISLSSKNCWATRIFANCLTRWRSRRCSSRLQMLDEEYHARHEDGIHDMLLRLGDLTAEEIAARTSETDVEKALTRLTAARRLLRVRVAGETRYVPVEYAARYRDAFGIPLPPGLPEAFLRPTDEPLQEIARRYARTHAPFPALELANRSALEPAAVEPALRSLHAQGKLLEGEFLPKGSYREWCDPEILQQIRRKSLANLRREIEPVEQKTLSRLLTRWQGVHVPRKGLDALLDAIEVLQGTALLASDLEREILPARVAGFEPNDLDALMAAGEVVWTGVEQVGDRDGRIALYLTEALPPAGCPRLRSLQTADH